MKYKPTVQSNGMTLLFGGVNECPVDRNSEEFPDYCQEFVHDNNLDSLTLLSQTHSADGAVVKSHNELLKVSLFQEEGDFIITNQPRAAIAVLTADCLPVIMHDPVHGAVGVAHAGWKGTVAGISRVMIQAMQELFNTKAEDLKVWLGPAAQTCCYEVQRDFVQQLSNLAHPENFLQSKDSKLFFDGSKCNVAQLEAGGVAPEQINRKNNICTICSDKFYSHRRQGAAASRQLSFVWLGE